MDSSEVYKRSNKGLTVGSPKIRQEKLQWKLVPSWLLWLRKTPKDYERITLINLQRIGQEVITSC